MSLSDGDARAEGPRQAASTRCSVPVVAANRRTGTATVRGYAAHRQPSAAGAQARLTGRTLPQEAMSAALRVSPRPAPPRRLQRGRQRHRHAGDAVTRAAAAVATGARVAGRDRVVRRPASRGSPSLSRGRVARWAPPALGGRRVGPGAPAATRGHTRACGGRPAGGAGSSCRPPPGHSGSSEVSVSGQ